MDSFDIPIFKKTYDLYKLFHKYRKTAPKSARFTVFEKCELTILDLIKDIFKASGENNKEKLKTLKKCSTNLNVIRVFIRLMKDIKAIDKNKYIELERIVDQIGRQLGGWIKSLK